MSEQQQRVAWRILAAVALALTLTTGYLFMRSQRGSLLERPSYRIAFMSESGEGYRIVHCNLNGSNCEQIAEGESLDIMPAAAPPVADIGAAPRIAFLRFTEDEGQENGAGIPGGVYVLDIGNGQLTKVSAPLERVVGVAPSWSPDAQQIAFGAVEDLNADGAFSRDESGVYVSDLSSNKAQRVASGLLGGWKLSWSADGAMLLVTGMAPGDTVPFVFALEPSSGITYTHPTIGQIACACWSPDGDRLAAYSKDDHQVHVLDRQGEEVLAFEAPYGDILELVWLPPAVGADVQAQLFAVTGSSYELGAGPLYQRTMSSSSSDRWTAVPGAQGFTALLSASPDGQYIAFSRFSSEHQGDLYVLERGDPQPRQLTSDPGFEGAATWLVAP